MRETGRFEHGRLIEPRVRKSGELVPVSWGEALTAAAEGITAAKQSGGAGAVAVIGGARLTNESAYAWAKLAKGIIGTDSVDAQLGDGLPADLVLGLPRATIDEAAAAPLLVTLCGDLREELPVLFLRLREAVVQHGHGAHRDRTDPVCARPAGEGAPVRPSRRCAARGQGAHGRRRRRWARSGTHHEGAALDRAALDAARALLAEHPGGDGVVIVAGRASYAESGEVTAEALRTLAAALPKAKFLPALRRGNVFGALDMGLAPGRPARTGRPRRRPRPLHRRLGLGPRRARSLHRRDPGRHGRRVVERSRPPPPRRSPRSSCWAPTRSATSPTTMLAKQALSAGHFVVAVTGHPSQSVDAYADVVLPCAVAHERPGTTTNLEGRVTPPRPQGQRRPASPGRTG